MFAVIVVASVMVAVITTATITVTSIRPRSRSSSLSSPPAPPHYWYFLVGPVYFVGVTLFSFFPTCREPRNAGRMIPSSLGPSRELRLLRCAIAGRARREVRTEAEATREADRANRDFCELFHSFGE